MVVRWERAAFLKGVDAKRKVIGVARRCGRSLEVHADRCSAAMRKPRCCEQVDAGASMR